MLPQTAIACTVPLAFGFQGSSAPVCRLNRRDPVAGHLAGAGGIAGGANGRELPADVRGRADDLAIALTLPFVCHVGLTFVCTAAPSASDEPDHQ